MFATDDTIVAIATPPGRGGIGVVRVSGCDAQRIAERLIANDRPLVARQATLVNIRSSAKDGHGSSTAGQQHREDDLIDQAVVTLFPAPHSYTGEHVVEISAHGSPVVLQAIVAEAVASGARLAEPGEFTLRAFLNGRVDLPQAEAVADLIDAVTPFQARAAFDQLHGTLTSAIGAIDAELFDLIARLEASVDFPEEGFHFVEPGSLAAALDTVLDRVRTLLRDGRRGRIVREGLQVAILGPPNVGKSSLFNALVGSARAIVTEVPGTTRDLVSETVDFDGLRVTLVDTAGLRETDDIVESEGIRRSRRAAAAADLSLFVLDRSADLVWPASELQREARGSKMLVVANKSDLPPAWRRDDVVDISATTGEGLPALRRRILEAVDFNLLDDRPAITNIRHIGLLERAHAALAAARAAVSEAHALPEEFILADLQHARTAFEEITGRRTTDDVLAHIFGRFCVGK